MSDVEDSEFYNAFEDELYKETISVNSSDEIDSELEEKLYQNVHFASSFVETPFKIDQDNAKDVDLLKLDTDLPVDGESIFFFDKKGEDVPSNNYPEVKLVFSNEKKVKPKQNDIILNLSGDKKGNDEIIIISDEDNWKLHEKDLTPSTSSNSKSKRSRLNIRCFNCHERGHRTFECTQQKKTKACSLCGMAGHLKQQCPNELCYNCREPGHVSRHCSKPRCRRDFTCHRCHAYGHFENLCPDKWRQYHLTIKQGEIITPKEPLKRPQDIVYCCNCGSKRHLGHECLEECENGHFDGSFPFVVKYDKFTSSSSPSRDRNGYKPSVSYNSTTPNHQLSPTSNETTSKKDLCENIFSEERPRKRRKMEDSREHESPQGDNEVSEKKSTESPFWDKNIENINREKKTSKKTKKMGKQNIAPENYDISFPRNLKHISEEPARLAKRQMRQAKRKQKKEEKIAKKAKNIQTTNLVPYANFVPPTNFESSTIVKPSTNSVPSVNSLPIGNAVPSTNLGLPTSLGPPTDFLPIEEPKKLTKREIRRANRMARKAKGKLKREANRLKDLQITIANGENNPVMNNSQGNNNKKRKVSDVQNLSNLNIETKTKKKRKKKKRNAKSKGQEGLIMNVPPSPAFDPIYPPTTHNTRQIFVKQNTAPPNDQTAPRERQRSSESIRIVHVNFDGFV